MSTRDRTLHRPNPPQLRALRRFSPFQMYQLEKYPPADLENYHPKR